MEEDERLSRKWRDEMEGWRWRREGEMRRGGERKGEERVECYGSVLIHYREGSFSHICNSPSLHTWWYYWPSCGGSHELSRTYNHLLLVFWIFLLLALPLHLHLSLCCRVFLLSLKVSYSMYLHFLFLTYAFWLLLWPHLIFTKIYMVPHALWPALRKLDIPRLPKVPGMTHIFLAALWRPQITYNITVLCKHTYYLSLWLGFTL